MCEIKTNRTRIQNVRFEFSLNRVIIMLRGERFAEVIFITILRKMLNKVRYKVLRKVCYKVLRKVLRKVATRSVLAKHLRRPSE